MKKVIFMMMAMALFCGTQAKAQANSKGGKLLVGGGLGFATEINTLSIFANGVYKIADQWEGSLQASYFFPKDTQGGDLTWLGLDLDGHYVFYTKQKFDVYGLTGLQIMHVTYSNSSSDSSTDLGLNLGAGGRYQLTNNLYGLGELKYTIQSDGFLRFNVGVLFMF